MGAPTPLIDGLGRLEAVVLEIGHFADC